MSAKIRAGAKFKTWKEFQESLDSFQHENHVLFRKVSGKLVTGVNTKLEPGVTPYDEILVYKNITLKCKNGGYDRPSESKGLRPKQRTFNIKCPAQITVLAQKYPEQSLIITVCKLLHNHATSFKYYPENRRLDKDELSTVTDMVSCRGKSMDIRAHLRKSKSVTAKDLANIKGRIQKENRKGPTDEEDLLATLEDMKKKDPGSFYKIGFISRGSQQLIDDNDPQEEKEEVDFVMFQTSEMRKNFCKYPEIIGMDTTYNVNKHNMHLSVMLVVDNHGNGRIISYVFMRRETAEILETCISVFTNVYQDITSQIKTIIVDKDYKEIAGIKKILPHVHVHLCYTHVHRIFKHQTKDEKHRDNLRKILKEMSVSGSEEEFNKHYENMKLLASDSFIKYFDKNWKDIEEAWVMHVRAKSLSLGIRSTNYVESHNEKIKRVVKRTSTLADCVRELLRLHATREFDSAYKDFQEVATKSYIAHNKDPDIDLILDKLTDWGAKLLVAELRQSQKLRSADETHESGCSCQFYLMFGMGHCRHIFAFRRLNGEELLHTSDITSRWLKSECQNSEDEDNSPQESLTTSGQVKIIRRVHPLGPQPMDKTKKYKQALKVCSEISSVLSLTGGRQYEERMGVLETILRYWSSKKEVIILPMNSDRGIEFELVNQQVTIGDNNNVTDHNSNHSVEAEVEEGTPINPTTDSTSADMMQKCPEIVLPQKCCKCSGPAPRKISQKSGRNYGRYYYTCASRCQKTSNFFRWEACTTCLATDVRQGHYNNIHDSENESNLESEKGNSDIYPNGDIERNLINSPDGGNNSYSNSNSGSEKGDNHNAHAELDSDELSLTVSSLNSVLSTSQLSNYYIENPSESSNDHDINVQAAEKQYSPHRDNDTDSLSWLCGSTETAAVLSSEPLSNYCKPSVPPAQPNFQLPHANVTIRGQKNNKTKDALEARRLKGKEIPDKDIKVLSPTSWLVVSQENHNQSYKIVELKQFCKISSCMGKDPPCCHMFQCSCKDFQYHKLPCKHIHKIFILSRCESDAADSTQQPVTMVVQDIVNKSFQLPNLIIQGRPCFDSPAKKRGDGKRSRLSLNKSYRPERELLIKCNVCNEKMTEGNLNCSICSLAVHYSVDCSVPTIRPGAADETVRVCRKCLCSTCKAPKVGRSHCCRCYTCQKTIVTEPVRCSNCDQAVHRTCRTEERGWCHSCISTSVTGLNPSDMDIITSGSMITDVHISMAMQLLKVQFPYMDGLQDPLPREECLNAGEGILQYAPSNLKRNYVQIVNTGHEHWVTCIIPKGSKRKALVLDSTNSGFLSSFCEQQLALIFQTEEMSFQVAFPYAQDQGMSMDCGPLAIAFATEFCNTLETSLVEYDTTKLRSHLLQCLKNKVMEKFPGKRTMIKKSASKTCTVKVYCQCRLPENYDNNMIGCSRCREYFHFKCVNLSSNPTERHWLCPKCSTKV